MSLTEVLPTMDLVPKKELLSPSSVKFFINNKISKVFLNNFISYNQLVKNFLTNHTFILYNKHKENSIQKILC